MKNSLFGLTLATITALGVASTAAETSGWNIAGVNIANPLDSKTWYEAADEAVLDASEPVAINPTDPDFWMSLVDPKTHSVMHRAFLNPRSWAQFAKVETYSNMMDPQVWVKWAKPETYAVLVDPQTYTYRMQPGAFMHTFDAHSYAQLANPSAYLEILTTAMDTLNVTALVDAGKAAVTPESTATATE